MDKRVILLGSLLATSSLTQAATTSFANNQNLSYIPRVYLQAYTGDALLGSADLLAPVYLKEDRVFFAYAEGRESRSTHEWQAEDSEPWMLSVGLGYRQVLNNWLFGGYLLADYSGTAGNEKFWDFNPGLELLGKNWDFRANGYFPISKKSWEKEGWADEFGEYGFVRFEDHKQYDRRAVVKNYEEIAPGFDLEVGRKLFKTDNFLVKAYLGGYYFDMQDDKDVFGGRARVTMQPSEYITFSLNDSYDRYSHNTVALGMRLALNDLFLKHPRTQVTEDQDVSVRLLDMIERNLGNLRSAAAIPSAKGNMELGGEGLERDHLWFVKPASASDAKMQPAVEDGTHENPYIGWDQAKLDAAQNDPAGKGYAYWYFAPGNYPLTGFLNSTVTLPVNNSMWGRTADFTSPAGGAERALFEGKIHLSNSNDLQYLTTLDSIQIHNDINNHQAGIVIGIMPPYKQNNLTDGVTRVANIGLNNVEVGTQSSKGSYSMGIGIYNADNVLINNSQINAYSGGIATTKKGIEVNNSDVVIGDNNLIISTSPNGERTDGIVSNASNGYSKISIGNNNQVVSTSTGEGAQASEIVSVGTEGGVSEVDINGTNNLFTDTAIGEGSGEVYSYGIYSIGTDGGVSQININGSGNHFTSMATNEGGGNVYSYGIYSLTPTGGSSYININGGGNQFNVTAASIIDYAYGIKAEDSSVITFNLDSIGSNSNSFTINGKTDSWGIYADETATIQKISSGTTSLIDGTEAEILDSFKLAPGASASGAKIYWTTHFNIPWTTP